MLLLHKSDGEKSLLFQMVCDKRVFITNSKAVLLKEGPLFVPIVLWILEKFFSQWGKLTVFSLICPFIIRFYTDSDVRNFYSGARKVDQEVSRKQNSTETVLPEVQPKELIVLCLFGLSVSYP